MKLAKRLLSIAAGVLGMALPAASYGSTISFTDSDPLATTNWSKSVSIPLFDPAWGTLNSISFQIQAHVESDVSFESKDKKPATIVTAVQAALTLTRPDMTVITQTTPTIATTDSVTAFDGILDFGGTSGRSYVGLTADTSFTSNSSAPADLALFSGTGNITLPVSAELSSKATGAGNLVAGFASAASAAVTVTYDFTPGVPAPAAAWGGGIMLAGVVLARFRRGLRA
ncbi:MAG: choice-of-anchor E domain-containing protein [Tepidisphaerales bacterium]